MRPCKAQAASTLTAVSFSHQKVSGVHPVGCSVDAGAGGDVRGHQHVVGDVTRIRGPSGRHHRRHFYGQALVDHAQRGDDDVGWNRFNFRLLIIGIETNRVFAVAFAGTRPTVLALTPCWLF